MSTAPKQPSAEAAEIMKAFVNGAARKQLGLQSIDLAAGLTIAKNHLQRGAQVEAMRTYVALVLCEPANVEFQVGLANCCVQVGEPHLAIQAASAVIALAPADPRGYFLSGRACLEAGHLAEAEEDLRDAVEFGKKSRDAAIVEEAAQLLQKISATKS